MVAYIAFIETKHGFSQPWEKEVKSQAVLFLTYLSPVFVFLMMVICIIGLYEEYFPATTCTIDDRRKTMDYCDHSHFIQNKKSFPSRNVRAKKSCLSDLLSPAETFLLLPPRRPGLDSEKKTSQTTTPDFGMDPSFLELFGDYELSKKQISELYRSRDEIQEALLLGFSKDQIVSLYHQHEEDRMLVEQVNRDPTFDEIFGTLFVYDSERAGTIVHELSDKQVAELYDLSRRAAGFEAERSC